MGRIRCGSYPPNERDRAHGAVPMRLTAIDGRPCNATFLWARDLPGRVPAQLSTPSQCRATGSDCHGCPVFASFLQEVVHQAGVSVPEWGTDHRFQRSETAAERQRLSRRWAASRHRSAGSASTRFGGSRYEASRLPRLGVGRAQQPVGRDCGHAPRSHPSRPSPYKLTAPPRPSTSLDANRSAGP